MNLKYIIDKKTPIGIMLGLNGKITIISIPRVRSQIHLA